MNNPIISIVMPAYNADRFIAYAIKSVIKQTFKKWELIIVDDCSIDNTYQIVNEYTKKEQRIKLYQLNKNSGSAYIPRLKAIELSTGEWILNLDADDYIEETYLQSIYNRAIITKTDHIIPQIIKVSEDKRIPTGWECPTNEFDFDQILTGKEACMLTIGRWIIGGAGVLIQRKNYITAFEKYPSTNHNINADELLTRKLLLVAHKVSFCHSKYYYRSNSNSITVKFSHKLFDVLDTNIELKQLINKQYPKDSFEIKNMEKHMWKSLCHCVSLFIKNKHNLSQSNKNTIYLKIKNTWKFIDWNLLDYSKIRTKLLGSNFYLFYLLFWIKHVK